MMKDERNYHQRLQEFCDCFMETDYRKELEKASKGISGDPDADQDELALKLLGLGLLYGANEEVKKISLAKSKEGKALFTVDGRGQYQLPPPQAQLADRIFSIVRSITHIEEDRGSQPLSLGLRNDRMEITLELNRQGGAETLTLLFPQN